MAKQSQSAEEFLESVGELGELQAIDELFGRVDLLDTITPDDINEIDDKLDYDDEDEYQNEQQVSGLHPHYGDFDDPDAEDEDYLWIE